jgi:hypothetical protein
LKGLVPWFKITTAFRDVVVVCEFVCPRNQSAETTHIFTALRQVGKTLRPFASRAMWVAAPPVGILNQGASPFDDLELEWSRQRDLRYLDFLEASWTGFEASLTMPTHI